MSSIEHLRYVARASGAEVGSLAAEAAYALGSLAYQEPRELLTASRRLLHAQPAVGPLWWLCARLAVSADVAETANDIVDVLHHDRTARDLAHELSDDAVVGVSGWPGTVLQGLRRRGDCEVLVLDVEGQGFSAVHYLEDAQLEASSVDAHQLAGLVSDADLVIVEAAAAGDAAMLTDAGAYGLAAVAKAQNVPVWAVVAEGRHLPEQYFSEILMRIHEPDRPAWISAHDVIPYGLIDSVVLPNGRKPIADLGKSQCPFAPELLR